MRLTPFFASVLALGLTASIAAATVTEPNGLQVPQPAPSNEISLDVFFAQRGEGIDWQADASTTPNAFSPLCGFTATYVLNDAGSSFGLAWYNETGTQPTPAQLYPLVPAGAAVGTMFTGTSIMSDPNYLGGLVGFALVGGQTHYTNPAYDVDCMSCTMPGNWVTALMYASTVTPNAYYICFEDGNTSTTTWSNDGDFNDDVFFVTGISCNGGGQPCDTGLPGICAAGLTQCVVGGGTTCQQLNQPKTTETCNGLDDNCNGMVDEGDICPTGQVCDQGTCVGNCQGGEFNCPPNKVCSSNGHCVDPACQTVTCPAGEVCVGGTCKGPCDGITCPYPEVCRVGACVDPCMGVSCPSGEVCAGGVCVTSCSCQPCPTSTACDAPSGQCVDPLCANKPACGAGTHCVAGNCVDDCKGAVCPAGDTCTAGQCVTSMSATGTSSSSGIVFGTGGGGGSESGGTQSSGTQGSAAGGANGAGGSSGSHATGAGGSGGLGTGSSSKCGCRVVGEDDGGPLTLAGLALAIAAMRRRRHG
jgi:MYXO-CTERM domain-containing protein